MDREKSRRATCKVKEQPICLIGLDQALQNTGIAILQIEPKLKKGVIYTGVLKTNKKNKLEDRLSLIDKEIEKLLSRIKPELVGLEEVYPGLSGRTVAILSQVYSTITNACKRVDVEFISYSSSKVKKGSWVKKVGIEGTKEVCREWLIKEKGEGIKELEEHEVDAVGILCAVMIDKGIEKDNIRYMDIKKIANYTKLKELKE